MRRALLILALLLAAAAPAAAQDTIEPGQSVAGRLTASDPTLDDGSHYDVWRFQGQAEHRYRITLRSDDFDAYLAVGSHAGGECDDCTTDDDGAGGTDAQVEFTGSADGTYEIRANSYDADETGGYELTLVDEGIVPRGEDPADTAIPIAMGQTVTGELARGDEKAGGSYVDTYTYQGRAGETIIITLLSDEFDTYVELGAVNGDECTGVDGDDDGGEGTSSRLAVTLTDDGAYHVHVRSAGQGETGRYTLLVEPGARTTHAEAPLMPISPGETLSGRLSETDAPVGDGSFSEAWTFRGEAGGTYTITMRSDEFDAYLHFGLLADGEWSLLDTDDDGAGGTDAQLTLTLSVDGDYLVRAGSSSPGETGAYTLRVQRR